MSASHPFRVRMDLSRLEDRTVPADVTVPANIAANLTADELAQLTAALNSTSTTTTAATTKTATTTAPTTTAATPTTSFSTFLPDRTARPQITQLTATGSTSRTLTVFDAAFSGGVWAARADITGDGTADSIAAAGAGLVPAVAVFDGTDGRLLRSFAAYETTYTGGVVIATADLNGDGRFEVITGTDRGGGPRVRVFNGLDNSVLADFLAIDDANFRGGVRVSAGDVNGDGTPEVIAAAGFGGGPRVAIFDGRELLAGNLTRTVPDFFAFEPGLRNGAFVTVADLDGDGYGDLTFGAGPGGGPRVMTLSGYTVTTAGAGTALALPLANTFAGNESQRGGVRVSAKDLDGDGQCEILTGDGTGSELRVYKSVVGGLTPIAFLNPFASATPDGVYVG